VTNQIVLRHFWHIDDVTKNFVTNLVRDCKKTDQDVIITSVFVGPNIWIKAIQTIVTRFGKRLDNKTIQQRTYRLASPIISTRGKEIKNVWYTGENLRPPSDNRWNVTLSFEIDETKERNIYLPFWATRFGPDLAESVVAQEKFLYPRVLSDQREKFACAFIGNPEPTRLSAIKALQKIGKVDLFGAAFNNPVKDKMEILKQYKFNLCFENDLYPGYVTEKVFESWEAGCIPLWWGLDAANYLNPDSVINFAKNSEAETLELIANLERNEERLNQLRNLNLLAKPYDFDLLRKNLANLLS
jgi:hypothetical protein